MKQLLLVLSFFAGLGSSIFSTQPVLKFDYFDHSSVSMFDRMQVLKGRGFSRAAAMPQNRPGFSPRGNV
jgi:hypothetical protein